jgi:metallophosphoesterase superfamily enzyme
MNACDKSQFVPRGPRCIVPQQFKGHRYQCITQSICGPPSRLLSITAPVASFSAASLLPPYDTTSAFEKLEEALDRYDPLRVIALGDSFCGDRDVRLTAHDADWLYDLIEDREWFWISGPDQAPVPEGFGGTVVPHLTLGGIKFRFEPVRAPVSHEIAGRMHPVAQISEYGHVMRGRCFVSNGMRLILPSMGAYSAGANVLGTSFDSLLGHEGLFVWSINAGRVTQVASGQLLEELAA